jgi:hypothetical protein
MGLSLATAPKLTPSSSGDASDLEANDTRIAPDPFTAVLPALSALGAIASIAAVNWVAQDKTADRPKVKRKAGAPRPGKLLHGPAGNLSPLSPPPQAVRG